MSGTLQAGDLDAIESFFTERGAPTQHEVCPLAGVATTATLVERGYVPVEMSSVVVRALEDVPLADEAPSLRVRVTEPRDQATWIETSVRGWNMGPDFDAMIRGFALLAFTRAGTTNFVAETDADGAIATASLGIKDGIALLAGACTIPHARGRGAQLALMNARLAYARRQGCRIAMMAAEPGSSSQRNAERSDFHVAYTRTKWKRST